MDNNIQEKFEEKVVAVNRISKKTKGGNKIRFSALVVVGNKNGKVGMGLAKSNDVSSAIAKAVNTAKKKMITVPMVNGTIPHTIKVRENGSEVLLKPAPDGTGIKAGGPIRSVVEVAGIRNISSKMLGSNNKVGNVYATFKALSILEEREGVTK
jgi:small subunit ribosomal protein S5